MKNLPLVKKSTGESQPFNRSKLEESLRRSGATEVDIDLVVNEIVDWLREGVTTKMIYTKAFTLLRKKKRGLAARYSLKSALMELGPTGFPFEHFIGQIFMQEGFSVEVGQVLQGMCVQHEMDVIATRSNVQRLVECKFHNESGKVSSVQVPLYVRSRIDDIIKKRKTLPEYANFNFEGWLFTNTRFTVDAENYGKCAGLHLVSWDYPSGKSLKETIERYRLFPISILTELSKSDKQVLMNKGVVLCRQVKQTPQILDSLNLSASKRRSVLAEIDDL